MIHGFLMLPIRFDGDAHGSSYTAADVQPRRLPAEANQFAALIPPPMCNPSGCPPEEANKFAALIPPPMCNPSGCPPKRPINSPL